MTPTPPRRGDPPVSTVENEDTDIIQWVCANEEATPKPEEIGEKRTVFSPSHVELLKKSFEEDPYPGYETREALARCIGIEEDRVHTWFQNRRARTKVTGSKTMIRNQATTPYSRSDRRSPSTPGSNARSPTQQHYQPRSFHYPESYEGAGFWQSPLSTTQPGEPVYAAQQQNSQELNPVHYQPAAVGGTGLCETSKASNCPVPYYGAEMMRQPPPSAGNFCTPSSSKTPWSAMGNSHAMGNTYATGNYPAANPVQMLPEDYQNGQQSNIFPSLDIYSRYLPIYTHPYEYILQFFSKVCYFNAFVWDHHLAFLLLKHSLPFAQQKCHQLTVSHHCVFMAARHGTKGMKS
ncbi:mix-type homeobox gene 1 [Podarcis lilfordi]|uniref:Mix-type homeobox gene 1 n=1 Tax=Podarcis lilfordi TaxID=74358 RepID=A0AA35KBE2_9SAUR|nr:mix-type homeobox gene 1 [Podarcis lilfordi]